MMIALIGAARFVGIKNSGYGHELSGMGIQEFMNLELKSCLQRRGECIH